MVGATPSTFDLGGGTVPAFPRNYSSPSGFSSINPEPRTNYIPMGSVGTTSVGLSGTQTSFPYSQGMLAAGPTQFTSRLPQAPVAPSNLFAAPSAESSRIQNGAMLTRTFSNPFLPIPERYSPVLTQGLTPVEQQTSMPIEGGPVSLTGATAMTLPKTAEQQGRMATATPYGNIYATFQSGNSGPRQLENLNARDTAYVGRTPEQQQALIAQMRERGRDLAAQRTETMRNFADNRIPNRREMPAPQGRYGQPLTNLFPRSREAMNQARATVSPAAPMASFAAPQPAAPFIEDQRNPFGSIYGFSA